MSKTKIYEDMTVDIISALANACGFRVTYDRTPGADEWTLSFGHGVKHVQYVGTRQNVSAFLQGYAAMQIQTTQVLNEMDSAQQELLRAMRSRLKC